MAALSPALGWHQAAARRRGPGWHDELFMASQPPRQIAGIGQPADTDAEIDLLVDQIADGIVENRLDPHFREFFEIGGDGRRHDLFAIVERRRQPQHPGRLCCALRNVAIGRLRLAQDDRGAVIEQAPFLGQRHAPCRAAQQRCGQFLLQPADLMTDHCLGDIEPVGGGGEGAGLDHGGEVDEPVEVQKLGHSSPIV